MKKLFTLIELLIVIVILAILVAIIIPNTSSFKEVAIKTSVESNIRNLQTAVDLYMTKNNGRKPTIIQPTIERPQVISYDFLYPKYIKTEKPKYGYYWVDYSGKVWGSTVDAPTRIHVTQSNNEISWEAVPDATEYEIFIANPKDSVTGSISERFYSLKTFKKFVPSNKNKILKTPIDTNQSGTYLVNAYDQFGLPTAPFGAGYEGYDPMMPIAGTGTFFLTTNAHGKAVWDGIEVKETKPEGTDIQYSFATSNDGKTYSAYSTDISTLPKSQFLKVKVVMISSNSNVPILHMLKVKFHLEGEEAQEVDLVQDVVYSEGVIIQPEGITLKDGELEGHVKHIVQLPQEDYFSSISITGKIPEGTTIEQMFQSSADGIHYSDPTPYPEELPKGDYVKIITDITRESAEIPSPIIDSIVIVQTPQNPNIIEDVIETEEEWETIGSLSIIEDAGEEGDWIRVDTVETVPTDTRITYKYYTSNEGSSWSGPYETVDQAPNSRFFKVDVIYERKAGTTLSPTLNEMTIEYKKANGTTVTKKKQINPDGTVIDITLFDRSIFPIREEFTNTTYRSPSTTAQWVGGGSLPISNKYIKSTGKKFITYSLIKDVIPSSDGGFIIGGENDSATWVHNHYVLIQKLDADYNVTKSITFTRIFRDIDGVDLNFITPRVGGGYIAVLSGGRNGEISFAELDENLNLIKHNMKTISKYSDITGFVRDGNTYILAVSNEQYTGSTTIAQGMILQRYDSNFNLISEKQITMPYVYGLHALGVDSQGNIYGRIMGMNNTNNPFGISFPSSSTSYLVKLDKDFNPIPNVYRQVGANYVGVRYKVREVGNHLLAYNNYNSFMLLDDNLNVIKSVSIPSIVTDYFKNSKGEYVLFTGGSSDMGIEILDSNLTTLKKTEIVKKYSTAFGGYEHNGKYVIFAAPTYMCSTCYLSDYYTFTVDFNNPALDTTKNVLMSTTRTLPTATNRIQVYVEADLPTGTDYTFTLYYSNGSSTSSINLNKSQLDGKQVITLPTVASNFYYRINLTGTPSVTPLIKFVGIKAAD